MPRVTGCESTPDESVLCTHAAAAEAARRAGARLGITPVITLPGLAATAEPAARRGRQAGGKAQAKAQATGPPTPGKIYSKFI